VIFKFQIRLIEKLPSLKTSLDEMEKAGEEEQKTHNRKVKGQMQKLRLKGMQKPKNKADAEAAEN
jgi:hypothetical protein